MSVPLLHTRVSECHSGGGEGGGQEVTLVSASLLHAPDSSESHSGGGRGTGREVDLMSVPLLDARVIRTGEVRPLPAVKKVAAVPGEGRGGPQPL